MVMTEKISTGNRRLFSNKALIALFIPLVLEQTLSYSVGLIDSMMVASLGEAAVSGVALMDFIMTLLITDIITLLAAMVLMVVL